MDFEYISCLIHDNAFYVCIIHGISIHTINVPRVEIVTKFLGDMISLKVEESMLEDGGLYTIIAENNHGDVQVQTRVNVS